jgi:hypothetical protein
VLAAADRATEHKLEIWNAVILSVVSRSRCRMLLSEDLQDGFPWADVTMVNLFGSPRHPLLHAVVEDEPGRRNYIRFGHTFRKS